MFTFVLMENQILQNLQYKLKKRANEGLLRELPGSRGNLYDFASNDYLGLAAQHIDDKGMGLMGATGSRLLTGDSKYFHELESFLADHFEGESALVLNSGYQANLAILSALPQRGDTIIYDELSHACIKDGIRLSLAKHFPFRHNNMKDLEYKLSTAEGNKFVVAEGVYSMDGDIADLQNILKLCTGYGASLILDEAHSGGVIGQGGKGLSYAFKADPAIIARIYTFGKAYGAHGACFVGSGIIKDYLINFARPFIYTTALPLHSLVHIREAIEYQKHHPQLLDALKGNIRTFKEAAKHTNLDVIESDTAIQPVVIPGNEKVRVVASQIAYYGFDVRPILSPTVKKGSERLRICLHSFNSAEHIYQLVNLLTELPVR